MFTLCLSSKHTYTMMYINGSHSNGATSYNVLGASSGASRRCVFPDVGGSNCGGSPSYCGGTAYEGNQDMERGIYGGLDGGPLGNGYICTPSSGFGFSNICFKHLGGGFGIWIQAPLCSCDKKMTMQNLNDRLASYLDNVRYLEEENAQLECKIRDWYDQQGSPNDPKDYNYYYEQTEDLKKQLICATVDCRKLILDIHNNKLTADDFRMRYEAERVFRQDKETDIDSLRQVLDQLTLGRSDLEAQLESFQEELCCLKKNHEEKVKLLTKQAQGNLNVEVNSNPSSELQKALDNLRRRYEAIIEKNVKEIETWYESMTEAINMSKELKDDNNQVVDLKGQLQTLESNLQTQLSLRDTLQDSLAETQCLYNNSLAEIQNQICYMEQQLVELRVKTECLDQEYIRLSDAKCLLEHEIETYCCLLGEEQHDPEIRTSRHGRKFASFICRAMTTLSSVLSDLKSRSMSLPSSF
uniref:IF rod domain-containing protein n=1 Tax=Anolis carolinensis TaxID=28377 RepID=L7N045_ANOCA